MSKEDGTPRRATRLSASASTPTKPQPTSASKMPPQRSTASNPPFVEGPIALEDVLSSIPARKPQVLELIRLIGPRGSPMLPLFLHGSASTGKTRTVVQVLRHLNRPFVYASCRTCHSPRLLFECVADQLLSHTRCSENGYSSARRCDRPSEFVEMLRNVLIDRSADAGKIIDSNKGTTNSLVEDNADNMIYLIFDNVELARVWGKNSSFLSFLFKINEILQSYALGLIYISRATPDLYYSHAGSIEPLTLYFPDYTQEEIHQILIRNHRNPMLYSYFLNSVLKVVVTVTKRLDEIAIALKPLFEKYCESLTDTSVIPDEAMNRRLYLNISRCITPSLDEVFKVSSSSSADAERDKYAIKKKHPKKNGWTEPSEGLEFHMSVSSKYLLVSAFLASRNPATLDASMFDATGGSSTQKRKRKSSEASIQSKDYKAQDMLMKGPGSFSLERLLAIFQCIASVSDDMDDLEEPQNGPASGSGKIGLMSDVLLQLSTLLNANFITKGGSCPLDCSTRYRCTVDEETALKVARSINFPLSKYMYRR